MQIPPPISTKVMMNAASLSVQDERLMGSLTGRRFL